MTTVATPSGSRETTIKHYGQIITYYEVFHTRNGYRSGMGSSWGTDSTQIHCSRDNSRVHTLEPESKACVCCQQTWCLTSTETVRLIRDGEKVGGGGEREIIYLSLHCHHQNDFCIKVGIDESHFKVS